MLPKSTPIPPSGPNDRRSNLPPPPPAFLKSTFYNSKIHFGMLPKGVPIPPSGPNRPIFPPPPPPPPDPLST